MSPTPRWTWRVPSRALIAAALVAAAVVATSLPAHAAAGDVYAKGIEWCAGTYAGHGTLDGYGPPLDLNGKGGVNDEGWPIYAPGDGTVSIVNENSDNNGWGNAIIWKSEGGTERIHMAHLKSFGETGPVSAGDMIGKVGHTGYATGPHLHVAARRDGAPAQVELHGQTIKAGKCYVSAGPIPPKCLGQTATIVGSGGGDVLTGSPEDDVIVGMGGDDVISGGGGDDRICGRGGKDVIKGMGGADRIRGDDGADTIRGGGGGDRVQGGAGPDTLAGRGGADELFGQNGNDDLGGTGGADRLDGGAGNDMASFRSATQGVTVKVQAGSASGEGADTLIGIESAHGSRFPDLLVGDPGSNRLAGDAGDDVLKGRKGDDSLDGGHGTDRCTGGEDVVGCEP